MRYTIRPSEPSDGDRLVQVWQSSVAATHSFVSRTDFQAIDEQVQHLLPGASLWLALDSDGEPIGFMGLAGDNVDSLFVDGERRGSGVGRELLQFAMTERAHLTTIVNEENHQAVGFYQHMGFVAIGRAPTDEEGRPYPILHLRWERSREDCQTILDRRGLHGLNL